MLQTREPALHRRSPHVHSPWNIDFGGATPLHLVGGAILPPLRFFKTLPSLFFSWTPPPQTFLNDAPQRITFSSVAFTNQPLADLLIFHSYEIHFWNRIPQQVLFHDQPLRNSKKLFLNSTIPTRFWADLATSLSENLLISPNTHSTRQPLQF